MHLNVIAEIPSIIGGQGRFYFQILFSDFIFSIYNMEPWIQNWVDYVYFMNQHDVCCFEAKDITQIKFCMVVFSHKI